MTHPHPSLPDMEERARSMGRALFDTLPKGVGATLVLCNFGESGSMTYISNARREDVPKMLFELAGRLEEEGPIGVSQSAVNETKIVALGLMENLMTVPTGTMLRVLGFALASVGDLKGPALRRTQEALADGRRIYRQTRGELEAFHELTSNAAVERVYKSSSAEERWDRAHPVPVLVVGAKPVEAATVVVNASTSAGTCGMEMPTPGASPTLALKVAERPSSSRLVSVMGTSVSPASSWGTARKSRSPSTTTWRRRHDQTPAAMSQLGFLGINNRPAPPSNVSDVVRVGCPVCHVGPGEPCGGEWGGFHGQRYAARGAIEQLEHDAGAAPKPVMPGTTWAIAWVLGDDAPITDARTHGIVMPANRK